MNKMKALAYLGLNKAGIIETPIPEYGPNDAIIKTTAALVCNSDVHIMQGGLGDITAVGQPLGHEAVGTIYRMGSEVKGYKEGQRVLCGAITPCFQCDNCQRGHAAHCIGSTAIDGMLGGNKFIFKGGTMAEYYHVNDAMANLAPIPDSVPDEAAVYVVDMMSTGFLGAENANIPIGGTVAIFGQGGVGMMSTVGARLLGAGLIIVVENIPHRQELAKRYGADIVIDYSKVDPVEEILRITGGVGVDSAIEAIGLNVSFEGALKATRAGGTVSTIGFYTGDSITISNWSWGLGMSNKTIKTGHCPGGKERLGRLLRLIETGKVDPTLLTTHRFKLADAEKALRMMESKEDDIIKPLVLFD